MAPEQALERRLGPAEAASVVISNVVGVGIFTTPGIVAAMVPHPAAMLAVWVVGGLLAFAGASAYAELASQMPRAGGESIGAGTRNSRESGLLAAYRYFYLIVSQQWLRHFKFSIARARSRSCQPNVKNIVAAAMLVL